jgi:hypothetical protein
LHLIHLVLSILNLRKTWLIVFPEVEEFLLKLYGFAFPALLLAGFNPPYPVSGAPGSSGG